MRNLKSEIRTAVQPQNEPKLPRCGRAAPGPSAPPAPGAACAQLPAWLSPIRGRPDKWPCRARVLAGRFPQRLGRGSHIQYIVNNLESQTNLPAVISERLELLASGAAGQRTGFATGRDEGCGLPPVNGQDRGERGLLAFALEIKHLAAHHALRAHAARDGAHNPRHGLRARRFRQYLKGAGQQSVARQDGQRLAEDLVAGRAPAPQIVVIHGGKSSWISE